MTTRKTQNQDADKQHPPKPNWDSISNADARHHFTEYLKCLPYRDRKDINTCFRTWAISNKLPRERWDAVFYDKEKPEGADKEENKGALEPGYYWATYEGLKEPFVMYITGREPLLGPKQNMPNATNLTLLSPVKPIEPPSSGGEHLYEIEDGDKLVADLTKVGIKAERIGTLPSNHDIDILLKTVPGRPIVEWLTYHLDAIKVIKTDIGSYFAISKKYGHVDVFFSDRGR